MSSEHIKRINTYDGEKQIDYNSLANLPEIPQGTKDLVNDAGYLTVIPPPTNATLGGIKAQPRGLEDTAEAKLGADGKLYVNVLKNELDIQTKRIDSILSLENGSTTGDAELLDIRLGYDGTEYSSAGEAVRNQVKGVPNYGILVGNYIKFYRSSEEGDSDILLYEIDVTALLESGLSLENLQLSCETEDNIIILYMNDGKIEKSIELPIIVDDVLSISSTNPVQNRVITEQLNYVIEEIENIKENGIGGGEGVTVRLTNQNGSATLVGSYGNAISLMFTFTSTENDLPTGNANLKITVNSIQKVNMSIPQGLTSIDVAPYLNIGNNTVIVTCTDIYGKSRSLVYDVSVIRLSIESTFNAAVAYDSDILFKYKPYGAVEKTIHFVVDGTEIGTVVTSLSGKDMSRTIPKMSHGAHRLEVYSTATLNETELTSEKLVYDIICIEDGDTTPIIASVYEVDSITQGEQISIPYIVYDPTKLACDITLTVYTMDAGSEVICQTQDITVDRNLQHWYTRRYPVGDVCFKIQYGEVINPKIHKITVVESKIKIEPEMNDLELYLTAEGRSNNETNPEQWSYGNITTTFNNMNWSSVGWIADDNGDTCLRLSGDASAEIQFMPFDNDLRVYGKTIEMIFAVRDVNNRQAVPISCMSGDIGFEVKADTAYIQSEQSRVFCNYKEEDRVHLAFVIESKDEYRMLSVYLNGVMSDAIQYPATDNFQQTDPVTINIGSPYCSVDLYGIRSYSTALADHVLTTNYIADLTDIVRKTEAFEDNDIYDEFGAISFSKAKEKNSIMIIVGSLPTYKGDKKKCKIIYYDVEDSNLNWEESDVSIDVQGTSSQFYVRKNWKLKSSEEHYIDIDQLPGKVICIKVDYAEATGTHNTQNAVFVEKLYSEKIPPQEKEPKVRTTIYGKPILLFHQEAEGEEPVFYGKNYCRSKTLSNIRTEVQGWTTPSNYIFHPRKGDKMTIDNLEVYGIIYKITNIINNKVYIGQTTKKRGFLDRYPNKGNGIERVYKYHKRNKDSNQGYNEHLFHAIEKYGMDAFDVIEVFDYAFTQQELNEKEIYYINKFDSYNNGYNNTLGGGGKLGSIGLRGKDSPNSKKVYQISCDGEIIKLWECISDVSRVLHIDSSKISCVCRGQRKTTQGYVWVYEEDYEPNKDYSTKPRSRVRKKGLKPVTLLSEDGLAILKQYESVNSAAEDLKITTYEVSNICKNKVKNKKYNLKYTNEIYRGTTTKRESLMQETA